VAGHEAEAESGAGSEPPALIAGADDTSDGVSGENPPEVIEGGIGHEAAVEEAESAHGDCGGSDELGPAAAAHGASRKTRENHRATLGEGGKKAEAAERVPKKEHFNAGEEW